MCASAGMYVFMYAIMCLCMFTYIICIHIICIHLYVYWQQKFSATEQMAWDNNLQKLGTVTVGEDTGAAWPTGMWTCPDTRNGLASYIYI